MIGGLLREAMGAVGPSVVELGLRGAGAADLRWGRIRREGYCPCCGASVGFGAADALRGCAFCVDRLLPWDALFRLGTYRPPLSDWIVQMKFQRQWAWGRWFGRWLGRVVELEDESGVVVCAVGMHWRRRIVRGHNPPQVMAEALAAERGWAHVPLLRRVRGGQPQERLSRSAREQAVSSKHFRVAPVDLRGAQVVLVDDVLTTGTTLGACARLLKQAGARRVVAAAAAVADPRGADFKLK